MIEYQLQCTHEESRKIFELTSYEPDYDELESWSSGRVIYRLKFTNEQLLLIKLVYPTIHVRIWNQR